MTAPTLAVSRNLKYVTGWFREAFCIDAGFDSPTQRLIELNDLLPWNETPLKIRRYFPCRTGNQPER